MNTIKITTSQNIELEYELASLGDRIVGRIIDMLIVVAYFIILALIFSSLGSGFVDNNLWLILILILPIVFYDLLSELLMNGQSVGKKVMNIRIVSLDGAQASFSQYLIRWLFRLVDFTLTGGICALVTVAASLRKQRLGDIVAGTALIKTNPRATIHETIYAPAPVTNYTVSFPEVTHLTDKDMQLVKEVILTINRTGNFFLAYHAADKIKQTLGITTALEPYPFLQVLLADYNYLTAGDSNA